MMETKETNQSGAMKTLLVVTAAFGAHNRHPSEPPSIRPCSFPPHAPCAIGTNAVAGGAVVGTLTAHTLAPAPALKASFVAAEKMEPFKVCEPPHS